MTTFPSHATPRTAFRNVTIGLGLLILVVLVLRIYSGRPDAASALKRINAVPPFNLTERSGRTITNNDLFGKIWVAGFVYTACPGPCPLVTAGMVKVQAAVAQDRKVQLVTFTVDPDTDTPAVLAAYADKFGADKSRWWFLTGPKRRIYGLIRDGFFLPVEDEHGKAEDGDFTVTHSTKLALVDGNGIVRGYFDSLSADGRADLLKAVALLEKEHS